MVPLHKKKDKLSCDNYRCVSLLSHCGKVTTSIILQRILQRIRLRTEEILSKAQAGFRAGRSMMLDIPRTTTSLEDRAFAVAGPRVWNSLSPAIRDPSVTVVVNLRKTAENLFVCLRVAALVTYELALWKCTD